MIIISKMPSHHPHWTRYFLFSRVNPRATEIDMLLRQCDKHDVFLGYRFDDTVKNKVVMKGFMIMQERGDEEGVHTLFPNFLIKEMPKSFQFDYHAVTDDFVVEGCHPYTEVTKDLFRVIDGRFSSFIRSGNVLTHKK